MKYSTSLLNMPPTNEPIWHKPDIGVNIKGLPEGVHTGGPWVNTVTGEYWKPTLGRAFYNSEHLSKTNELQCLIDMQGQTGFPDNWRAEHVDGRTWIVRPKCFVVGKEYPSRDIKLESALYVEKAFRNMLECGWLPNDELCVAFDKDTLKPFILDLSSASFDDSMSWATKQELSYLYRWFEFVGLDWLAELRKSVFDKEILPTIATIVYDKGYSDWPGWDSSMCHVYAAFNRRGISKIWARELSDCYIVRNDDFVGNRKVYAWVVSDKKIADNILYKYELTWAYSPLERKI